MKKYRNLIFYISVIGIFLIIIYLIIKPGQTQFVSLTPDEIKAEGNAWQNFLKHLNDDLLQPTAILILQIAAILSAVRIFGWICKKTGQPAVVGEIIAGVVLGPSLLGLYLPEIFNFIFPPASLGNISFLSQIGLILFMFIVGMELNLRTLKNKAIDALIISHISIAATFTIGVFVAYYLFSLFNQTNKDFLPFALFMGIAMSIAAFPVMARIIHERGINKTHIGPIIITCAAIDDITAWCLLASVIAIAKAGSMASTLFVILLAIIYIYLMFNKLKALTAPIDKMTRTIVSKTEIPVGIFIDKDVMGIRNVFVPILDEDDLFMGSYMERLASNSFVRITLWDPIGLTDNSIDFIKTIKAIKSVNPYLFQLWNNNIAIGSDIINKQDLMMISLNSWRKMYYQNIPWKNDAPSTIVLNN